MSDNKKGPVLSHPPSETQDLFAACVELEQDFEAAGCPPLVLFGRTDGWMNGGTDDFP